MTRVYLALYKADGNIYDKLVRWRTGGWYSHCELVIDGVFYTASNRDGGVRAKVIVPDENWDLIPIPGADAKQVRSLFYRTAGDKYDWLGIVGHALGLRFIRSWWGWWICSRWCAKALGLPRSWAFNPQDLADYYGGRVRRDPVPAAAAVAAFSLALAGCATPAQIRVDADRVHMPANVRMRCEPLPVPGDQMNMGNGLEYTSTLIGMYGECAARDSAKADWIASQER